MMLLKEFFHQFLKYCFFSNMKLLREFETQFILTQVSQVLIFHVGLRFVSFVRKFSVNRQLNQIYCNNAANKLFNRHFASLHASINKIPPHFCIEAWNIFTFICQSEISLHDHENFNQINKSLYLKFVLMDTTKNSISGKNFLTCFFSKN